LTFKLLNFGREKAVKSRFIQIVVENKHSFRLSNSLASISRHNGSFGLNESNCSEGINTLLFHGDVILNGFGADSIFKFGVNLLSVDICGNSEEITEEREAYCEAEGLHVPVGARKFLLHGNQIDCAVIHGKTILDHVVFLGIRHHTNHLENGRDEDSSNICVVKDASPHDEEHVEALTLEDGDGPEHSSETPHTDKSQTVDHFSHTKESECIWLSGEILGDSSPPVFEVITLNPVDGAHVGCSSIEDPSVVHVLGPVISLFRVCSEIFFNRGSKFFVSNNFLENDLVLV